MKLVYSIGFSVFIGLWCYGCLSFENELRISSSFLLAWNSRTMICFHKSFPEPSPLYIENHLYKWKSQIFFWFSEFLRRSKVHENVPLQILACYANVNYYFSKSKCWISLHTYSCIAFKYLFIILSLSCILQVLSNWPGNSVCLRTYFNLWLCHVLTLWTFF